MRATKLFYLVLALLLAQCVGSSIRRGYTISDAESIRPGLATGESIVRTIGKPHKTLNFRDFPETNHKGIMWFYFDENDPTDGTGRISIYFEEDSPVARSVSWKVRDGEPLQNVQTALKKFESYNFTKRSEKSRNPHSGGEMVYFENEQSGVTIHVRNLRQEVSTIEWIDPKFDTSSAILDRNKPNPEFCLDGVCGRSSRSTATEHP